MWALLSLVSSGVQRVGGLLRRGAAKRAAAEAGIPRVVTAREADDLLRAAEQFIAMVEVASGRAPTPSRRPCLTPRSARGTRWGVRGAAPTPPGPVRRASRVGRAGRRAFRELARRASELAGPPERDRVAGAGAAATGAARRCAAPGHHGGGRRGGQVSLVLALLAAGTSGGGCLVGGGGHAGSGGALAAAQAGVDWAAGAGAAPGPEWTAVVAALLDGVDLVVVAPPGPVASGWPAGWRRGPAAGQRPLPYGGGKGRISL